MTIEGDYSLRVVEARGLHHELFSRSVGGWFGHVWHVNPLVGADSSEPPHSAIGPPTLTELQPGHSVLEGHVALSPRLRRLPPINLLLAQAALFWHLSKIVRKHRVSIVRAGDPYYLGLLAFLLAKLHGRAFVVKVAANYDAVYDATGRSAYPRLLRSRRLEKRIERALLKRADLVAAANQNNLEYVLANGARPDRATIFRYGSWVDPAHFAPLGEESDLLARLGLGDRDVVVFVGRLEPVKHPDEVVTAFAGFAKQAPEAALLIVGDGSMRGELEQLARRLGVADRVCFTGALDQLEIRSALRGSNVILAPLAGRALVEATLSGTPVVAYDIEWHSELIGSGSGVLVPYRDVKAMAGATLRLLQDPDLAAGLGARARERCLEMMDPQKLADHERSAYEAILARS